MRISASMVDVLAHCAHLRVLADPPPIPPSDAMALGADVHRAIERWVIMRTHETRDADDTVGAHVAQFIAALGDEIPYTAECEVSFAVDIDGNDSTVLGVDLGRDYRAAPDGWFCGTADVVWRDSASVVVLEIKTGHGDHGDAGTHAQLRTLMAMAARAYGCDSAKGILAHVRVDACRVTRTAMDVMDIDGHIADMRSWLRAPSTPSPGAHCERCPGRTVCPATTQALDASCKWTIATPADVARVWHLLGPIEDKIRDVRRVARELAAVAPIPLPDGRELRIVEQPGRETVSVSALRDALGDEAVDALRAQGAIKRGAPYVRLAERRAKDGE